MGPGPLHKESQCWSHTYLVGCAHHARKHTPHPLVWSEACSLTHTLALCLTHSHRVNPSLIAVRGGGESGVVTPRRARTAPSPRCPCRAEALAAGSACGEKGRAEGGTEARSSSPLEPQKALRGAVPVGHSPRVIFLQEVGQHVYQGDVEKATRGEGQDAGHGLLCSGRRADWLGARGSRVYCTPSQGRLGAEPGLDTALGQGPSADHHLPPPTTPVPTPLGDCVQMAKQAPSRPPSAVESCSLAALHRSKPARSRMAKSPT